MCLIVDVNVAQLVFLQPDINFKVVNEAIFKRCDAMVVYGGKLTLEYSRIAELRKVLLALDRSGRAKQIKDADVNARSDELAQTGKCQSNDYHVIALAQLSRARLLCSDDAKLTKDFKNKDLLDQPRGQVYHSSTRQKSSGGARDQAVTIAVLRAHCSR